MELSEHFLKDTIIVLRCAESPNYCNELRFEVNEYDMRSSNVYVIRENLALNGRLKNVVNEPKWLR